MKRPKPFLSCALAAALLATPALSKADELASAGQDAILQTQTQLSSAPSTNKTPGWHLDGKDWYYYEANGSAKTGWLFYNGSWYWLDTKTGKMATSTTAIDKSLYAFDKSGAMINNGWGFGADNKWYLASAGGALKLGWQWSAGAWYLLDTKTGAMKTGWAQDKNLRYWMDDTGAMTTGWRFINGAWYHMNQSGAMETGWRFVDGAWYLLDTNTGAMHTGWAKDGNTWYYLRPSGAMATGWINDNNAWYWADASGAVQNQSKPAYIYLDAGHNWGNGEFDSGALGNGYREADLTKDLCTLVAAYATQKGSKVYLNTNGGTSTPDFRGRQVDAQTHGCNVLVSIHFNASDGTGSGYESYIHSLRAAAGSSTVQSTMHARLRAAWGSRLINRGQRQEQFAVISGAKTNIPSTLLEVCFIDNSYDIGQYQQNKDRIARELADGIVQLSSTFSSKTWSSTSSQPIMGKPKTSAAQMTRFLKKGLSARGASYPSSALGAGGAKTAEQFSQIVYEEATAEGVRPEVAMAQIACETNYLQFGGDVKIEQHNFAGLGATGNGEPGNSFANVRTGVRAQVQHLKAYASTDKINNACVDQRFAYVTRGTAPTVASLEGKWATSAGYGTTLTNLVNSILAS